MYFLAPKGQGLRLLPCFGELREQPSPLEDPHFDNLRRSYWSNEMNLLLGVA